MKVFVVSSAGGSFCWNCATDTFYGSSAGGNFCRIYAGFELVPIVSGILVDLSVAIKHVTVSLMHVTMHNRMHITISIVIMHASLSFIAV